MILAERVLSIIGQYDVAGGINQANLIAEIARGGDWDPSEYTDELVRAAIWTLLQDDRIQIDHAKKLRLPKHKFDKGTTQAKPTSGIYPVGPGDPLYNWRGERVATVVSVLTDAQGRPGMLVKPDDDVRYLGTAPGTEAVGQYGEVVSGTVTISCDLDHGALQDELIAKNMSGSCPDCGCHLWTEKKAFQPGQSRKTIRDYLKP